MNREEIDKKFASLPADIKSAITSADVAEKILEIARSHKLHVDQTGILEEEISLAMLGINHPDNLVNKIEDRIGLPTDEAVAIAVEVNEKVFLTIRESLQKIHASPLETAKTSDSTERADILAEIENPTPVQPPISSAGAVIPKIPQATTVAHEFIAGKMSEPVSLPAQKYSADPYREPLA